MRNNVTVKGYRFPNKDKFLRAVVKCGETVGDKEVLTAYDKMSGKILKEDSKGLTSVVPTGTFWNFKEGQPQKITLRPKEDKKEEVKVEKTKKKSSKKKKR